MRSCSKIALPECRLPSPRARGVASRSSTRCGIRMPCAVSITNFSAARSDTEHVKYLVYHHHRIRRDLRIGSSGDTTNPRVAPGAAFVTCVLGAFSLGFAFVFNVFGGLLVDPLHGRFTVFILLLGAEVNHAIEA